jgi:hypothetical protein
VSGQCAIDDRVESSAFDRFLLHAFAFRANHGAASGELKLCGRQSFVPAEIADNADKQVAEPTRRRREDLAVKEQLRSIGDPTTSGGLRR